MKLRIATRGSKLALWQAEHVRSRLCAADPELEIDLVVLKTQGDLILDRPLAEIGGKALFVKEIEQALLDGRADIAVHSMKDVPAELAPGLMLAAMSERADPRDALCTRDGTGLDGLAPGAAVGTSSLRRGCQLLARRSDLVIEPLRGNVPTRVGKLDDGKYDAIVLAVAGLVRLGHGDRVSEALEPEVCLPAVGQGVLGIETRTDDDATAERVRTALHHESDAARVRAERAFLAQLEGDCKTPLAAHGRHTDEGLVVDALVGTPDGSKILRARRVGAPADAETMGKALAEELLSQGAADIIAACAT